MTEVIYMRVNIFYFFFIPWILATLLFRKKNKMILYKITPFATVIATILCVWGDRHHFWVLKPVLKKNQVLTTMPLNLGLYPVFSSIMVYLIMKTKESASSWILVFTCFTTILEFIMKWIGRAAYGNDWNLNKTFISYFIPYYLIHKYSQWFL
ncbi:CBO0543 family protein [Alkalihalophilus pseudofirmus]|uniref:CBO0543 family protein n=1 Tax=Alkalihalophilus pseudofirmus TaxID=79885 RepID=A0AAJ2KZ15_ALKPS|nr:CBO0543 family protein [Alkalihalophilus pseudofirmus]MDV2883664.1 CBO0543 family protein [Alkalihalophilus pseudofirmus]WEG17793.1 hypothetical protein PQ478_04695 [Alkalihalophilus pseudofirmus]